LDLIQPVGSRSNGQRRLQRKPWRLVAVRSIRGVGSRSGCCGRTRARGRRRMAASGSGAARDRARGLSFVRGLHRDVACETVNSSRAARSAGTRRGRRAARRGGAVRRCYSGKPSSATCHTGSTTRGTGELLTSLRSSGTAPRRRRGGDGEGQRWRRLLGFRRLWRGCSSSG
jgi:hypothetical protein